MSTGPFPDRVDAARLFARYGRIDAALPLQRLARLQPSLADTAGEAAVSLQFGFDAEGRKQLTGSIRAELRLACQRCLRSLPFGVASELDLLVFNDRQELERQLQDSGYDRDVLVLDEARETLTEAPAAAKPAPKASAKPAVRAMAPEASQELDLLALVEDELLLSLPLAPMHENADCSEEWNSLRKQTETQEREVARAAPSPFAVLAQLKPAAGKAGKGKGSKA